MRTVFELGDGLALAVAGQPAPKSGPTPAPSGRTRRADCRRGSCCSTGGRSSAARASASACRSSSADHARSSPAAPSSSSIPGTPHAITMRYTMDRVERLGGRRHRLFLHRPLDEAREAFALLYRRAPLLRRPLLAASNGIRWLLRVRTRFEQTTPVAVVPVTYAAGDRPCDVVVSADLSRLPDCRHRGGADERARRRRLRPLRRQRRRRPARRGHRRLEPGPRRERLVRRRGERRLVHRSTRDPDPGAPAYACYRGREVARGRLAWAGFGYSLRPGPPAFTYTLRVARDEVPLVSSVLLDLSVLPPLARPLALPLPAARARLRGGEPAPGRVTRCDCSTARS